MGSYLRAVVIAFLLLLVLCMCTALIRKDTRNHVITVSSGDHAGIHYCDTYTIVGGMLCAVDCGPDESPTSFCVDSELAEVE
jgi:hypothetical protein